MCSQQGTTRPLMCGQARLWSLLQTCRCAGAGVRVGCSVPQRGDHDDSHARGGSSLHPTGSILDGQAVPGVDTQAVGCGTEAVGCRLAVGHLAWGQRIYVSQSYWQAVSSSHTARKQSGAGLPLVTCHGDGTSVAARATGRQ